MRRTAFLLVVLALVMAAPAAAREGVATSADGTQIHWSFFPAPGLASGERAPTVLEGTGWAFGRIRCMGTAGCPPDPIYDAGYNVLRWDPRGFGDSGGQAEVDLPEAEGRDVQALLDLVAAQPEAQLDAPGDPRAGMAGESYGGGIQLVAAALDDRIDAIMPALVWHDLPSAVTRSGAFKSSWMTLLVGAGVGFGLADGYNASQGPQTGSIDPRLLTLTAAGLATGRLGASDVEWLAARGPAHLLDRVKAPALLLQSTADTLFPLDHAVRVHERLRAAGTPSKLVWYCGGGHGACPTSPGPAGSVDALQLAWLDRWLRGGPPIDEDFEWVADDGVWRRAPAFPLPADGLLAGAGRGTLTLVAGAVGSAGLPFGLGVPPAITMPQPDAEAVRVPLAAVAGAADVASAPRLRLTYRGLGLPASTFAFAQLVDERAGRVVGFQSVPVPLVLDGRTRTAETALGQVALRLGPESRLRVELATASPLHAPQRSTGRLDILDARATLAYAR